MQMQQFIRNNTNYPDDLKSRKVSGRATISFTVDTDGAIINPKISAGSDVFIIDKEALRTILVMPDWIPAENEDGTPVQAQHTANVAIGNGGGGMGGMGFGF
jgi:TonB family protein